MDIVHYYLTIGKTFKEMKMPAHHKAFVDANAEFVAKQCGLKLIDINSVFFEKDTMFKSRAKDIGDEALSLYNDGPDDELDGKLSSIDTELAELEIQKQTKLAELKKAELDELEKYSVTKVRLDGLKFVINGHKEMNQMSSQSEVTLGLRDIATKELARLHEIEQISIQALGVKRTKVEGTSGGCGAVGVVATPALGASLSLAGMFGNWIGGEGGAVVPK